VVCLDPSHSSDDVRADTTTYWTPLADTTTAAHSAQSYLILLPWQLITFRKWPGSVKISNTRGPRVTWF